MKGKVLTVSASSGHHFSKEVQAQIRLLKGLGVEGDAHSGATVKHRSRVKRDPTQPNLRQIHIIHRELFDELLDLGFELFPGAIGENILTDGLPLIELPTGTHLRIGESAVVEITGSRNPCWQLDEFTPGLMKAVLDGMRMDVSSASPASWELSSRAARFGRGIISKWRCHLNHTNSSSPYSQFVADQVNSTMRS